MWPPFVSISNMLCSPRPLLQYGFYSEKLINICNSMCNQLINFHYFLDIYKYIILMQKPWISSTFLVEQMQKSRSARISKRYIFICFYFFLQVEVQEILKLIKKGSWIYRAKYKRKSLEMSVIAIGLVNVRFLCDGIEHVIVFYILWICLPFIVSMCFSMNW